MTRATWNGALIAESDKCVIQEGQHYFPREAVRSQYLRASSHETVCSWKGTAKYYDLMVDKAVNLNAAWYYPEPSEAASSIAGHVAFWMGVQIEE